MSDGTAYEEGTNCLSKYAGRFMDFKLSVTTNEACGIVEMFIDSVRVVSDPSCAATVDGGASPATDAGLDNP